MDPALAYCEYIGATLIEPSAAEPLADALEATWRRDPDCITRTAFRSSPTAAPVGVAPIGAVEWVEVDNHDDLRRAREIAARC